MSVREKFNAIADEIEAAKKKNQPVLVGTASVEKSELLSSLLKRKNIKHETLNAKNHAREASIITNAGKAGCVTIATNMAGRGTDIVLGPGVKEAGGLYVIGTERHESRRIDNQLRGRSGRQGDPGRSKFFLSLEDDLLRIFGSGKLTSFVKMDEGEALVSKMLSNAVEKAQRRVEEQNFSSRKHLLEYDDVMNQQRQVVYARRRLALYGKGDLGFMWDLIHDKAYQILQSNSPEALNTENWDFDSAQKQIKHELGVTSELPEMNVSGFSLGSYIDKLTESLQSEYQEKMSPIGENLPKLESFIYLQVIDQSWKDHLLALDSLRDSVSLRGYGQRDPLQEYKKEAFNTFARMIDGIEEETSLTLLKMPPPNMQKIEEDSEHYEEEGNITSDMNLSHAEAPGLDSSAKNSSSDESQQQPYVREGKKVGRNDPCPCGSGKKYKKCCA